MNRNSGSGLGGVVLGVGALLLVGFLISRALFGYFWHDVAANEIAIQFRKSQITNVVGPGNYNDTNWWADITNIKIEGVPWCAQDDEVITKDKQRVGVKACGTVHRPGLEQADVYRNLWSQYRTIYTSDDALVGSADGTTPGLMTNMGQQAMKVCVGDRNFDEAVVGAARDGLRECIDSEVDKLAKNYGLRVENLTVPNVIIGPSVQTLLDQITDAKYQTKLAEEAALKAKADADRQLAEQQGEIRVEQGRIQETERQQAITAGLQKERLVAQQSVIEAQKANDLQTAQLQLAVEQAELEVAKTAAQAEIAGQMALATLFQQNPIYAEYMAHLASTQAWGKLDKVIVPAGTSVDSILSPDGSVGIVTDVNK